MATKAALYPAKAGKTGEGNKSARENVGLNTREAAARQINSEITASQSEHASRFAAMPRRPELVEIGRR
ncbi:MAG: hypothetical protein ABI629_20645 [bacterium]